jgi:hypothetical protein
VATADLKSQILQRLLAFPALVREFDAAIARECAGGEEITDRQILEVRRAAASSRMSTCGALQEVLAQSEHVERYRALVARELAVDSDIETAREELDGAFSKLELQALDARLEALARQPQNAETLAAFRELSDRRSRLKRNGREAGAT